MDGFAEVAQGLFLGTSLRLLGRARHTFAGNALFSIGYALLAAARKPCKYTQAICSYLCLIGPSDRLLVSTGQVMVSLLLFFPCKVTSQAI